MVSLLQFISLLTILVTSSHILYIRLLLWNNNPFSLFRFDVEVQTIPDDVSTDMINEMTAAAVYWSFLRSISRVATKPFEQLVKRASVVGSIHSIVNELCSSVVESAISTSEPEVVILAPSTSKLLRLVQHFTSVLLAALVLLQRLKEGVPQRGVRRDRVTTNYDPLASILYTFLIQSQEAAVALRKSVPVLTACCDRLNLPDPPMTSEHNLIVPVTLTSVIAVLQGLQRANDAFLARVDRSGTDFARLNPWTKLLNLAPTTPTILPRKTLNASWLNVVVEAIVSLVSE